MGKPVIEEGPTNELGEDVGSEDEEVWGKSVPLAEPVAASNPVAPIEDDRGVAGVEDIAHPPAPTLVKPTSTENGLEAFPINRVKGFSEVNFKDHGGPFTDMAGAHKISNVDDVF